MEILLRCLADGSKQSEPRTRTDAGKLAKRGLGFSRRTIEFTNHEVDYVIGVVLGVCNRYPRTIVHLHDQRPEGLHLRA